MVKRDIRESDDCEDFKEGNPNGECMSDGHYMCRECVHYRFDFFKGGQDYIDAFFSRPPITIITLN